MDPVLTRAKGSWCDSRYDFNLSIPKKSNPINVKIDRVRTYGFLLGWVFYIIGTASYNTSTKDYVNKEDFFAKLAKAAERIINCGNLCDAQTISRNISKDKLLKTSVLTDESIKEIFENCIDPQGKYYPKINFSVLQPQNVKSQEKK